MLHKVITLGRLMAVTGKDLLPIVLVVAFFQIVVLRQPFPDLGEMIAGLLLVTLGLTLFIRGLEMGLFPLGESMADAFARKGVLAWLLVFGFALGFGTTVAEPALIAVAGEAAAAEAGVVATDAASMDRYATGLRYTVALSVGAALVVGVIRILKGWPIQYFIIGGYLLVMILTPMAPDDIVGIAYDSGGVMTPSPKMVHGLATVREAIDLMREHAISSVVVEKRYDGDEHGLLVVTDIASKVIGKNRSPERTNVYEIMTKPVISVDKNMDIKYACRLLANCRISRALVTDGGNVVGIVTLRDMVLRYLGAKGTA